MFISGFANGRIFSFIIESKHKRFDSQLSVNWSIDVNKQLAARTMDAITSKERRFATTCASCISLNCRLRPSRIKFSLSIFFFGRLNWTDIFTDAIMRATTCNNSQMRGCVWPIRYNFINVIVEQHRTQ